MSEFSSRNIIQHQFHVNNDKGELGIGYDMIIGRDLMVQLGLPAYFKHQFLQWDGAAVTMKGMSRQSDITSRNMHKVVMHTSEPVSTRQATD